MRKMRNLIKRKEIMNGTTFLDIDNDNTSFISHLVERHPNAIWRKSANSNLHVIKFDEKICLDCILQNDEKFNGFNFFNNKGKKWANPYWINGNNKVIYIKIEPTLICHIFVLREYDQSHLYTIIDKDNEEISKNNIIRLLERAISDIPLNTNNKIFFTFHSCVWKGAKTEVRGIESITNHGDIEFILKEFNYKPFRTITQVIKIMNEFIKQIPGEFL